MRIPIQFLLMLCTLLSTHALGQEVAGDPKRYFAIHVVDGKTNRGAPLVELKTVSNVRFYTDSAGYVAIDDPALMGRKVFFSLESHGYEFRKDGFGIAGVALDVKAGEEVELKIERKNVAERLYRVTGEGIYRDSVMLGKPVPIEHPLLNGQVTGQDSVQSVIYNDKIYLFWGDTNRQRYPLGHFGTSGATALLPGKGGLDPGKGINLNYFTDAEGFSRAMGKVPGKGLIWIDNVLVVKDEAGRERMLTHYALMKDLGTRLAHGILVFNDQTETFEHVLDWPGDALALPTGHAFRVKNEEGDYFYFSTFYPTTRVKADFKAIQDHTAYEAFTCLKAGRRYAKAEEALDRDAAGKLVWGWKRGADVVDEKRQKELIAAGLMKQDEAWYDVRDVESGKAVTFHGGSIAWNEYRKKWIGIALEIGGKPSMLGEAWYTEAETPEGPWRRARKVVSHDRYSFYNPRHHPFFDQEGGKLIYFEGTYSAQFSRQGDLTPRYDYNQVMYRLDLSDPRLKLDR